jgi:hypothetical protein
MDEAIECRFFNGVQQGVGSTLKSDEKVLL